MSDETRQELLRISGERDQAWVELVPESRALAAENALAEARILLDIIHQKGTAYKPDSPTGDHVARFLQEHPAKAVGE